MRGLQPGEAVIDSNCLAVQSLAIGSQRRGNMAEKGKGNMRHFIASLTAIAVSSSAYAGETVLYSNNVMAPVPGEGERLYRDGPFSDAMTSQGLYYNSQAFGQTFSIARDSTGVSRLRVWDHPRRRATTRSRSPASTRTSRRSR
jgi:hypothetical protein